MLKRIILKSKLADDKPFIALLKIIYFNLIKINRFIIYEFDLTQDFDPPFLNKAEWEIKVLHHKELEMYVTDSKDLPREFKMHEIGGVKYCVVVLISNEIAHISWIYMEGDKNRWFNLGEGEAQLNYCFTLPEYRGKGLFPNALLASVQWFKKRNFSRILMDVHEGTTFMINSLKKVPEMKKIGTLTHWCFYRPKFRPRSTVIV